MGQSTKQALKQRRQPQPQENLAEAPGIPSATLHAARSGQWIEPDALRRWAIEQLQSSSAPESPRSLIVDLQGVEHLDASALQVLLAMEADQRRRNGVLQLTHASQSLRRWFEYAGAADLLQPTGNSAASAAAEEPRSCAKS